MTLLQPGFRATPGQQLSECLHVAEQSQNMDLNTYDATIMHWLYFNLQA